MTIVQSPQPGNALRRALALDTAGALPLEFQGTVVPVAIVADVSDYVRDVETPAAAFVNAPAVAGQYTYLGLERQVQATPSPRIAARVNVVRLWAATTLTVYGRASMSALAGGVGGLARHKRASQNAATGNLLCRTLAGSNASTPTALMPDVQFIYRVNANEVLTFAYPEPWILDGDLAQLVFMADTVNQPLFGSLEWVEYTER